MSMTTRDVLFMMRARDYASREVRGLGASFGALGKAMQAVDTQLRTKLNDSMQRQSRMIQQSKDATTAYAREIDKRIAASLSREAAALDDSSVASRRYAEALTNNAYLTDVAKNSQKQYADEVKQANTDIREAATQQRRATARQLAYDIESNQEQIRSLNKRNSAINAMQQSMKGNLATRQKSLNFATEETSLYQRNYEAVGRYAEVLDESTGQLRRRETAEYKAYKAARDHEKQLRSGTMSQQEYAKARDKYWRAERAINQETIGELDRQIARRREIHEEDLRQIGERSARRARANTEQVNQQKQVTDDRINQLKRERDALTERHRAYQEQIKARGAAERDMLRESARRYGEHSATHQRHLREAGEAERRRYEQEAENNRRALEQYQRKIQILQAVGIAATVAGAALFAMSTRAARSFQNMAMESANFRKEVSLALTQIQNDTPASIDSLTNIAREIGTEIPAGMDKMGSTLFFIFSSLRVNTAQASELLRGFAKEAVAGNTDIESAARSTIAILNGMGLATEDLTRVQDFQFQTVRRGVITYEQLSNNLGKLIPALRRSGQEIETGGAMLAFLTRQGLSAEMATTSAARALELIADPRVVNRLEDMGITVRDTRGEFVPLVEILGQMNDRIGDIPAPQRAQELLEIFGGAGYRIQARRFFDTAFANFDHFLWQVEEATNNAGAMEAAYEIVFSQPLSQMQLFQNNLEVLRQEMGDRFLPILMEFVNVGLDIVTWFRNLDEATKDSIANFAAFSTVAGVVSGALLILVGGFLVVASLVTSLTSSVAGAVAITAGVPAVIMAAVGALTYLALNYDDVSGAIGRAIDAIGLSNEQFLAIVGVVGAVGVAFASFYTYMQIATGGLTIFTTKLKALLMAHPLLATFAVVVGTVSTAIYLLGRRSREVNAASRELAGSLDGVMAAFTSGEVDVKNYRDTMRDAQRATVEQMLAEKELNDVIYNSPFNTNEIVDGILNVNNSREEMLRLMQEEIDTLVERERAGMSVGSITTKEIRDLQALRDEYTILAEAAEQSFDRQLAMWRDEGGLTGLIAEYIQLMEHGSPSALQMADALHDQITEAVELSSAWGDVDPNVREALESMDGGEEILSRISERIEEQKEDLMALSGSWESIVGVVDSVIPLYQEKLEELNASNREAADEAGQSYEDITSSLGLFEEAMNETTQELDWALEAQRSLREMYGDDVVAWWSQLYQEEPALAREIHAELLDGDMRFYEQMRANRLKAMDFVLEDIKAHGLPIVDEYGRIHDETVEIVATAMGMHPSLVRAALQDSNVIAREQMGTYKSIIDGISGETLEALQSNLAGMSNEDRNFHLMGDSWGRALINGINAGITNTPLRSVPRPPMPRPGEPYRGFNNGGLIPGSGPDRDSVLAYLTTGEYVIRRKAVEAVGRPFLDRINALNSGGPVGFNGGGMAGGIDKDLGHWMPRYLDKYEFVMGRATDANIQASNEMISAIDAMDKHLTSQHELGAARNEVDKLRESLNNLEADAVEAAATLEKAREEARKITASEELNIISNEQNVRSATRAYEEFGNGIYDLNRELEQLRQEERVAELQKNYDELKNTVSSDGADSTFLGDLAAAQARLSAAKLEMQRVQSVAPGMQDEVQALLLQFKAENELADAYAALNDLEDGSENAAAGANELRIAEIELQLAMKELDYIKQDSLHRDEQLRAASLSLTVAQEDLAQAHRDAIGPTDEVREAQSRLEEIQQQQLDTTQALRQARVDLGSAELNAMSATMGLITAGQKLTEHGFDQIQFFKQLADSVGMAESNINSLMTAMTSLSGGSANYAGSIEAHSGIDRTAIEGGRQTTASRIKAIFDNRRVRIATEDETEWGRLNRIAHEVMSGQRTMDDVRQSVDRLKRLNIGTYDNGGILRPGLTLAYNGTGQNEFITRQNSMGSSLTIERGAINIRIDGDSTQATQQQIERSIQKLLEDLYDQMRSE